MTTTLPFSLLLVTDDEACARAGRTCEQTVRLALDDDARGAAVLLRDKRSTAREVEARARALLRITDDAGALLLVHTHVDVARALGLAGVHVADGVDLPEARGLLVGASRHEGAPLDDERAGYLLLAPVFSPTSKRAERTLGLEGLRAHVERASRPIVALGGIDAGNAERVVETGVAAIAVVGAVMSAPDPRASFHALMAELHSRKICTSTRSPRRCRSS